MALLSDDLQGRDEPPVAQADMLSSGDGSAVPQAFKARKATDKDFWKTHESAVREFVDPERYGLVQDAEHVAGFLAHRIGSRLDAQAAPVLHVPDRVELVSLLKFSEPRVYVSDYLPAMDELRDAPTRPLDAFEQQGLAALKNGEDIVSEDKPPTIRALGALRALKQCLQCHTVEEGRLLGAFSYRWGPAKPTPQPVPPTPDAT